MPAEDRPTPVTDRAVDGPGRETGSDDDRGASSQDRPGGRDAGGQMDPSRSGRHPDGLDTNERADDVATVQEPD